MAGLVKRSLALFLCIVLTSWALPSSANGFSEIFVDAGSYEAFKAYMEQLMGVPGKDERRPSISSQAKIQWAYAQLSALKAAKAVAINDEETRYSVALVGFGATIGVFGYAAAKAASKLYGWSVLTRTPVTRAILTLSTLAAGTYLTVRVSGSTAEYLLLTEDQLKTSIRDLEVQIANLKSEAYLSSN